MILGRHSYLDGDSVTVHRYYGAGEPEPTITVGNYTSIASDVELLPGGMHQTKGVSTFPLGRILPGIQVRAELRGPISIGHDVWVCRGARILGGATIGNGAIIGAYAVITGTVPAYHVAYGNPTTIVPRPQATHSDALHRIAWWDWPDGDPRLYDVHHLDVETFVARHDVNQ